MRLTNRVAYALTVLTLPVVFTSQADTPIEAKAQQGITTLNQPLNIQGCANLGNNGKCTTNFYDPKMVEHNGCLNLGTGNTCVTNIYKSTSYQRLNALVKDLESSLQRTEERIKKYPQDSGFQQEKLTLSKKLNQANEDMKGFKQQVFQLAIQFAQTPLNTERLKEAKRYFEQGKYDWARELLNKKVLVLEKEKIDERWKLNKQLTEQLKDEYLTNANEFVVAAQLAALDYKSGRIERTKELYEEAIGSTQKLEQSDKVGIYFSYAYFLQENNQFSDARKQYNETLTIYRQLAEDNPAVYQPDVGRTLNNLAILVSSDTARRLEAETLYTEALTIRRQLAKDNPAVYQPDVATTLNNLAVLVSFDTARRLESETLYTEALTIKRQLAEDNPAVYQPGLGMTLHNLAALIASDTARRHESETLYTEALTVYRQLAKDNPAVYQPDVGMTLNNLAALITSDTARRLESEKLYTEALTIRRQLAEINPNVFGANYWKSLVNYANALKEWQENEQAYTTYQHAIDFLRALAVESPSIWGDRLAHTVIMSQDSSPDTESLCKNIILAEQVVQDKSVKGAFTNAAQSCRAEGF